MRRELRRAWPGLAAFAALASGCGAGSDMAAVSGRVTYRGAPVVHGAVAFLPADGRGTPATGMTDFDGRYTLQTRSPGDGARVGAYLVTVSARKLPRGTIPLAGYLPTKKTKTEFLVPERYERPESSALTATVRPGSNDIPLTLD